MMQKLTGKLYEDENFLSVPKVSISKRTLSLRPSFEINEINKLVSQVVNSAFAESVIPHNQNMLLIELDSIQALEISGMLKAGLQSFRPREHLQWIDSAFIFAQPSIDEITSSVAGFLSSEEVPKPTDSPLMMSEMIEQYCKGLCDNAKSVDKNISRSLGMTVVIMGTTGTLGSRLLLSALLSDHISRITCLNRSFLAQEFQEQELFNSPEGVAALAVKARFLTVDITRPKLALPILEYESLAAEADAIIYNAWSTNHILPLSTFSAHIGGIRSVIDLAACSMRQPTPLFRLFRRRYYQSACNSFE